MRLSSSAWSLVAIAVVFVVGSAYLALGVVRVDWFSDYTHLKMTLSDSGNLQPRSPVLLSGVRVGEVTGVQAVPAGVDVQFRVDSNYSIPVASTARIENLSALGEPYIEFAPTIVGGPYLRDGEAIDTTKVQEPLSIPEMANSVTAILNQLDPAVISQLVGTFATGLQNTDPLIPTLSHAADLLASTLLARQPELKALLTNLQAHANDMSWVGPSLTASGPRWGKVGTELGDLVNAVDRYISIGKVPDDYTTGSGLLVVLNRLAQWFTKAGPDLRTLAPAVQPLAAAATSSLQGIDISTLIAQALATTDADAVRLQINTK